MTPDDRRALADRLEAWGRGLFPEALALDVRAAAAALREDADLMTEYGGAITAIEELTAERDHWKANHDAQRELKRKVQAMYQELRDAYKEATSKEAPPPRAPEAEGRPAATHESARPDGEHSPEEDPVTEASLTAEARP